MGICGPLNFGSPILSCNTEVILQNVFLLHTGLHFETTNGNPIGNNKCSFSIPTFLLKKQYPTCLAGHSSREEKSPKTRCKDITFLAWKTAAEFRSPPKETH